MSNNKENKPGGKGDAPRKGSDYDAFRANYDRIFRSKPKPEQKKEQK